MKKIISLILVLVSVIGVFSLAGCGNDEIEENEKVNGVQLGEGENAMTVDEATIKNLLAAYPQSALGLKNEIYDYKLKLTSDEFMNNPSVKIEAYLRDEKNIEATFMFLGSQFYIYDKKTDKYLRLTVEGPVEDTTKEPVVTDKTKEQVNEENNKVLLERYKKYDLSVVKLPKDISEYRLIVTGSTAKSTDDETVYVIKVYENDGAPTDFRFAVGKNGDYYYNPEKDRFVKLK